MRLIRHFLKSESVSLLLSVLHNLVRQIFVDLLYLAASSQILAINDHFLLLQVHTVLVDVLYVVVFAVSNHLFITTFRFIHRSSFNGIIILYNSLVFPRRDVATIMQCLQDILIWRFCNSTWTKVVNRISGGGGGWHLPLWTETVWRSRLWFTVQVGLKLVFKMVSQSCSMRLKQLSLIKRKVAVSFLCLRF